MEQKEKRKWGPAVFMCYVIQQLDAKYYEKGNAARSHKYAYNKFIRPMFGISYHSFLKYIHYELSAGETARLKDFIQKYPELRDILFPLKQVSTGWSENK